MAEPGSTLRAMILNESKFDVTRLRALAVMVTGGLYDVDEARRLQEELVADCMLIEAATVFDVYPPSIARLRQGALERLAAIEASLR